MTGEPLLPWDLLESRQVFKDRWIDLRAHRFRTGDGALIEPYYIVHRHDWACILALDEADNVVTVRVWRPGIAAESIELPAGAIDAEDASPADAVRRELLEETGYTCGDIRPIVRLATNPANHDNFMHVFAARGARRVQAAALELGETLVTELVPLPRLVEMALSGGMLHGLQAAAVLIAAEHLKR